MWKRKCAKGALNNFNVWTNNNAKSNDFKRFTNFNGLSRRSKFEDIMKNPTCFQQIKFVESLCKISGPILY